MNREDKTKELERLNGLIENYKSRYKRVSRMETKDEIRKGVLLFRLYLLMWATAIEGFKVGASRPLPKYPSGGMSCINQDQGEIILKHDQVIINQLNK